MFSAAKLVKKSDMCNEGVTRKRGNSAKKVKNHLFSIFFLAISKKISNFAARMVKKVDIVAACKVAIMLFVVAWWVVGNDASAQRLLDKQSLVWGSGIDSRGRYTGRYLFVAQGFNITLGANYYYGDIDYTGRAFKEGFQANNLLGGVTLAYQHPLGSYFNLRSAVGVGALRGAVDSVHRGYAMTFRSLYFEPSVCVEYYPFGPYPSPWLGLYLFAGIGANVSLIDYNFGNPPEENVKGHAARFLPIVPFGLGWAFPLGRASGFMLHIELALHQGIIDSPVMNLDAYPQTKAQNGKRDYGMSKKPSGKKTNEWADGYFQAGVTVSYRWRRY
jgi:hypothetical protein